MPEPDCKQQLAQATETISHSLNEQRNAVHRSLYDRSQNQPLFRLRTYIAGDRALAPDGKRRAPCGDGAARRADDRRWPGSAGDDGQSKTRMTYETTCDTICTGGEP